MPDEITVYCECMSPTCLEKITIPQEEYNYDMSCVVIAKTCSHGPELTDELVEEHATYKVYKETEDGT